MLSGATPLGKDMELMPVLFVGHGSPMNALEDNEFSAGWRGVAEKLPKPKAILCVSAHWETQGTSVTTSKTPPTIHDFYVFPRKLYEAWYPAPGDPHLAEKVSKMISITHIQLNPSRGLDHGCWAVLKQMYPNADIPVIQLSLDETKPPQYHFQLAKELAPLRGEEILIIGSGNLVHNLGKVEIRGDINEEYGFDWAIEANNLFKRLIDEGDVDRLVNYESLGTSVKLSVPTPEHYLPMLYAIALRLSGESITYFNNKPIVGSITMTSFLIGS